MEIVLFLSQKYQTMNFVYHCTLNIYINMYIYIYTYKYIYTHTCLYKYMYI